MTDLKARASTIRKMQAMTDAPEPEVKVLLDKLAKSNGPDSGPAQTKSPEELAVQHGIATFAKLQSDYNELMKNYNERDRLFEERVAKYEQLLAVNKIEIDALRVQLSEAKSNAQSFQQERDEAKDVTSGLQALFVCIMADMRAFGIKNEPLIKDKPYVAP